MTMGNDDDDDDDDDYYYHYYYCSKDNDRNESEIEMNSK
jgi:hypothetical protein